MELTLSSDSYRAPFATISRCFVVTLPYYYWLCVLSLAAWLAS